MNNFDTPGLIITQAIEELNWNSTTFIKKCLCNVYNKEVLKETKTSFLNFDQLSYHCEWKYWSQTLEPYSV